MKLAIEHDSSLRIQATSRRHLAILRLKELCEHRAIVGGASIMNVELGSCTVIQKSWRDFVIRKKMEEERLKTRRLLENKAATIIVSEIVLSNHARSFSFAFSRTGIYVLKQKSYRGYSAFVQYVVKSYSIIQIQANVRGFFARREVQKLKQEEEEAMLELKHAAAITIVSR